MKSGSVRAAMVIAVIVVCSAIAGVAIDHVLFQKMLPRHSPGSWGAGRGSPEQDAKRRGEMLDRMTTELTLTTPQRQGIDSVMQQTDSSLRAIRSEMQPRLRQVFQSSRAEIEARLDSSQRIKFKAMIPARGDKRP